MDDLLTEFVAETTETLAALDDALLTLEQQPDDQARLADVFRLAHTIKGTCGFLGLARLERVAHAAEDLLDAVRTGAVLASPAIVSAVLAALDRIKLILAGLAATGQEPPGDDQDLVARLDSAQAGPPLPPAEPGTETGPERRVADKHSVRVSLSVLENLMVLVSELVLTRNQLLQVARGNPDTRLTAPLQRLSHLTSDLQEGAMRTRMQPIAQAWAKLPRLVRDLGAELGKPIRVVTRGAGTELDRQVLELIKDPLTHMVRNSACHGLEDPQTRRSAGKPALGTITLTAYHEGGFVVIEAADDGAGLQTERIRQNAIGLGLVTAAEAAGLTDAQVHRFIFHPGLSTAPAVSAMSGRGVGMDVVKTNVERLGGIVTVDSAPGAGAVFTLRIPLTLAIISALVVSAGGQRFALPQACVAELLRARRHAAGPGTGLAVEYLDGTPVLRLRDRLLPLVQLADLLHLPAPPGAPPDVLTVVVTVLSGWTVGLVVDRVFDTEEIVVKPVSTVLRHLPVFGGNTILGDGSVIMILDPAGLARAASHAATTLDASADPADPGRRRAARSAILLVRLAPGAPAAAVPLSLIARIEQFARHSIVRTGDRLVTPYRGQLMPLVAIQDPDAAAGTIPVLVFADRGRSVGLIVHDIIDVTEGDLAITIGAVQPGMLGAALVAGQVTEVIDTAYWLTRGCRDWFIDEGTQAADPPRLLVVEDSDFFRNLLVPALLSCGYDVTAVDSADRALALRDSKPPAAFDAIISDIDMPGMDGLDFARAVRSGGLWQATPMIALSGRAKPLDRSRGADAGFDDYIAKFDRGELLDAVRRHVAPVDRWAA